MKFMEDSLNLSLSEILPVLQHRIVRETRWFGVPAQKNPLDFWIYQEMLHRLQPDIIVEIGNDCGGSTLALAHLCDLIGKGRVIGVDVNHERVPDRVRKHPRITLIEGDASTSFDRVAALIRPKDETLVIEDSSHTFENTLNVLRKYSSLVKSGGYFIVEDGICHHGLEVGPHPGPYEAITSFLAENVAFEVDRSLEAFLITWNPRGFLRRT
jgi:cephalosporin hydroxylase